MKNKQQVNVKDIAITGMMIAFLESGKRVLDSIPNVELVTFLIIIFAIFYGYKTFIAVTAFSLIECFIYGFGMWSICYFYVWPLLVIFTLLCKKYDKYWLYCLLAGMFGLTFGAFCSITTLVMYGPASAFGWWLSGLTFDLVHGVSNFIVCIILYKPIRKIIEQIK